eukprot:Platyproteum_vivax@DN4899_c0_g1_i2.p1
MSKLQIHICGSASKKSLEIESATWAEHHFLARVKRAILLEEMIASQDLESAKAIVRRGTSSTRLMASVITLQNFARRVIALHKLQEKKDEWKKKQIQAALLIQKTYWEYLDWKQMEFERTVEEFAIDREKAAIAIQKNIRSIKAQKEIDKYLMAQAGVFMEVACCITIQKYWKGLLARRVLHDERSKVVLRWNMDGPEHTVRVCGNFFSDLMGTYDMKWCPLRECYVYTTECRNGDSSLYYRFIVRSEDCVDASRPITEVG